MKIVCDNCSTKYSIADEKVRGKVFKIKCKKCSHIIVVKGTEGADAGAPAQGFDQKETRVFDYSGFEGEGSGAAAAAGGAPDAIWHLVIDRDQVGPMTAAEVEAKFRAGEIDADTYAWREGFADWLRLGAIEEFAALTGGAAPAASPLAGADPFGGANGGMTSPTTRSDPADLFGGAAAGADDAGAGLFADAAPPLAAAADDAAGVFASSAAPPLSSRRGGDDLFAGGGAYGAAEAASPRVEVKPMTGQRNENSVLFSLSNLAALATEAPKAGGASGGPTPGFTSGGGSDGSGLIDIRAMAAMTLGAKADPAGKSSSSVDDLPVFSPSSFAAPAAGILLPTVTPAQKQNKVIYALIGLVGVLAIAAIVMVVVLVKGSDKTAPGGGGGAEVAGGIPSEGEPSKSAPPTPGTGAGAAGSPGAAVAGSPTAPPAPSAPSGGEATSPSPAGEAAKVPAVAANDREDRSERSSSRDRDRSSRPSSTSSSRDSRPTSSSSSGASRPGRDTENEEEDSGSSKSSSGTKCDEVACLVDSSLPCCKKSGSAASRSSSSSSSASSGEGGYRLSRSDIVAGIGSVRGRVMACNDQYKVPGTVMVKITIDNDGSVANAEVTGKFAGTPTGSCVENAVKKARFKKFDGAKMIVNYPFAFR